MRSYGIIVQSPNRLFTIMSYPLFHPSCERAPVAALTAAEFAAEFPREGLHVEFKEGVSHSRIAETAMAFSNADGGVLLLGASDHGTVRGVDLGTGGETQIRKTLGQVRDLGPHQLYRIDVDGRTVVAVAVGRRQGGFTQLAGGQIKERRGASNHTLLGAELADFIARRFVRTVESAPTSLRPEEMDPGLAFELAAAWQWPLKPEASPSELRDRLRDSGFVIVNGDGDRLSVAGALYLLADPARVLGKAFVEVFRYPDDGVDYDRREEFGGPLQRQVESAADFVLDELGFDLALLGVRRHELHRLPRVVVREAVANAVAHRSYAPAATSEAVRIEIRPDRVVVRSPGGLPEGVSLDDPAIRSVPRNVLAIRTLRFFGIAEDAGRGVRLMRDHMTLNLMKPPVFEVDGSSVVVTLRLGSDAGPAERAWLALTLTGEPPGTVRPYSVGDTGDVPIGLRAGDARVLLEAGRGETLTNGQVRDLLGVDVVEARAALLRLRDRVLLQQHGNGAGAHYVLAPHLTGFKSRLVVRSRSDELSDVAIELAGRGRVTNADLRKRTGIDRVEALRVLNALVAAGRLERRGTRRGSHYVRPESSAASELEGLIAEP